MGEEAVHSGHFKIILEMIMNDYEKAIVIIVFFPGEGGTLNNHATFPKYVQVLYKADQRLTPQRIQLGPLSTERSQR